MAAQRQLYGRAACALLVCVLAAALTAAQDDEEGEVRLDPRTCYHFYNGSACARPGVFEPSAGGNATYDPLGGEGFAGVYATPLSFDRHTGEWRGQRAAQGASLVMQREGVESHNEELHAALRPGRECRVPVRSEDATAHRIFVKKRSTSPVVSLRRRVRV